MSLISETSDFCEKRESPLTEVIGPTMSLINETHDFCKKKEYAFNILPKYNIITLSIGGTLGEHPFQVQWMSLARPWAS
jgi:hypothetical protein